MAEEVMKAMQYSGYGGGAAGLKHVNIPKPIPKKGEILVKVEAASINPVDWKIQDGVMKIMRIPAKFPTTPGVDVAGEVVSGGANVTDFAPGDKVCSWLDLKNGGAFAEYAIAVPKNTVKRPPEVSAIDGACFPLAGLTALQCLTASGVNIDGSYTGNILITAAAGGVGLYAVQLANLSGAFVTATAGERNMELIKSLGADEVLDYKTEEGAKLISPSGKKYDVVVNAAGLKWAVIQPQLSPTGNVQELTPSGSAIANSIFKKLTGSKQKRSLMFSNANQNDLQFMLGLLAEGKIKTVVDSKFPLDKAEDAWAKSIDGHATGKIVVIVAEE